MTGRQCYFRPPKRLNLNHMTLGIFFFYFFYQNDIDYTYFVSLPLHRRSFASSRKKIFSLASLGWIIYHRRWFAIWAGRQHPMIKLWINDYYNNDNNNNNNNYKNNNYHFYYCSIILVVFYLLINICYCVGFRAPRSSKDQFKQTCIKSYCAIHSVD